VRCDPERNMVRDRTGPCSPQRVFRLHPTRVLPLAAAALICLRTSCLALPSDPPGTPSSRAALATCHRGQAAPDDDAEKILAASLEQADRALAADDRDALAHFARFCALGEQARRAGASLSSLVRIWAIRDAVDRTLELAPEYSDALHGKGALLCSLPRLLGGDPVEGERLVRRAVEIDPEYVGARLFLAQRLLERGERAEAQAQAVRALDAAEKKQDPAAIAKARRVVDAIAASPPD
jgi:tetratricopeptide (TPR) repeat protein